MKIIHIPLLLLVGCLPLIAAAGEKPLMRDFMGINGHFVFKPELYKPTCRLVRNYHNINWDVAAPGDAITIPDCVNKVNWDRNVYEPWKREGFETDLCAMFGSFNEANTEYKQRWSGKNQWVFDYGKALAAHFGSKGKQSVSSIEIDNEPGADFDEATYQMIFRNMAAGIRKGDPQMKIGKRCQLKKVSVLSFNLLMLC